MNLLQHLAILLVTHCQIRISSVITTATVKLNGAGWPMKLWYNLSFLIIQLNYGKIDYKIGKYTLRCVLKLHICTLIFKNWELEHIFFNLDDTCKSS